jgi:sugar O-acyltransferase (sialic acid O-acetyltransferase NeuD family)
MTRVAIIGSNDLGQLIALHAPAAGWTVAGFLDNRKPVGTQIETYGSVLGDVASAADIYKGGGFDALMVGVGYTQFAFRQSVFEQFRGVIPFGRLVHPAAYVDPSATVGEGTVLLPGCVIDAGVTLGENIFMNVGVKVAHHTAMAGHSFIAPGVTVAGKASVGARCFLGVGSTISDHVTIADDTVIGAGALVLKNIDTAGTYIGVPARLKAARAA